MTLDSDLGRELLTRLLRGITDSDTRLTHVGTVPARSGRFVDWPDWTPEPVRAAFADCGVGQPWSHQAEAASLAHAGRHVVVSTGTASGKSLAYQLPVLTSLLSDRRATALYLSPTKALGADQLRSVCGLGFDEVRAAQFDGDTPMAERDWVRSHSRWVFTNPDMLHHGILSRHGKWSGFLRRLSYVVVDECHGYRGVFGSHVALLLRRLRRIAARYGAKPVFICASATVADPAESSSRLCGVEVEAVTDDGSPRGSRTVALWEPPLLQEITGENGAPVRRSAGSEAARLMADLVLDGARTLTFVRSRRGAELAALAAQRAVADADAALVDRIAAYRAGYLPEERRALEAALDSGELLGVASTNALELGIDVQGLDAVVIAGYPGTRASFWQQAGRAGRSGDGALVVFVARDDPLDTYLVHHAESLLGRPVEATVLDPRNPYVLRPHLACAAAEMPLTERDAENLGGPGVHEVLDGLVEDGLLRRRGPGWFWASPHERPHPEVDIRGSGGMQIAVVESSTGRMLGTVDPGSAHTTVHPGAHYLHRGESFVVDDLDLDEGLALVHAEDPPWSTSARTTYDVRIIETEQTERFGLVTVNLGKVEVTSQVVSYLRRMPSGEVLDTVPLDLPEQCLTTRSVWYTIPDRLLERAGLHPADFPGALHAAEHAAIGLLPLIATCDRWDIGGVSTALHADTGVPTVFVHDGHPGGAGFADRGHAAMRQWLTATRDAIVACECPRGCPSCVQSPKCGNGNDPLDKAGAVVVLNLVLDALTDR